MHPYLKFTAETENNKKRKYLHITFHKNPTIYKTSIYRKPTFTDLIIPQSSNHPAQEKYATIGFMLTDKTYDIHEEEYIIKDTIHNIFTNTFQIHLQNPPPAPTENTTMLHRQISTTTQKWTTCT
jgi:hypothetical protein